VAIGSVQRGVDIIPAGGTVNVETGVRGDFFVGSKLLTVAFEDGSSITQQVDDLDPTRRSLVVLGTVGNDTIAFKLGDHNGIRVEMNHLPVGTFRPDGRLIANGLDGSDDIEVSQDIHLSAWLYGGASGNNRLKGGGGNDVLIGGFGDDTLIGGGGRDLLIGDGGNDHLDGSGDDDILIGGFTAWDDGAFDSGNEAALAAIMAEWTSAHDYQTRVNNLVNGGGLNGDFTLTPDSSVFDDGSANVLDGNAGRDLFFAGLLDAIAHRRANEVVYSL
jgi:Ca2+-binding RTX toxin-like protein